ncbi:MAG: ABC transporter permease, partial [Tannerella sp.]|nr:ABC transporter permease [Tannerella sp.]
MRLNIFKKDILLRTVNLVGLSIIFASIVLSYSYVKKELSYDRFNKNAVRIVRASFQYGKAPVDGRFYTLTKDSPELNVPGIKDAVLMTLDDTGLAGYAGKSYLVKNLFQTSGNFFDVFSYPLLEGSPETVINAPGKAAVSRKYADLMFGGVKQAIGKTIKLSGRRFGEQIVVISGVFENFPETSHFHADLLFNCPDNKKTDWPYVYLLKTTQTVSNKDLAIAMDKVMAMKNPEALEPYHSVILPLTDIHLHGHTQRELEVNGNISYIYIIIAVNALLLTLVLFNLWLNVRLIFARNRRYYQLLRLNGAQASTVIRDEVTAAIVLWAASSLLGGVLAYMLFPL